MFARYKINLAGINCHGGIYITFKYTCKIQDITNFQFLERASTWRVQGEDFISGKAVTMELFCRSGLIRYGNLSYLKLMTYQLFITNYTSPAAKLTPTTLQIDLSPS